MMDEQIGFDRVEILDGHSPLKRMSRSDYERLELRERVRLLLAGSVRFYKQDMEIAPRQALKG